MKMRFTLLFLDLAVGAYASNQAVVLRTRPIASVEVEMEINPNPIPLNGSSLACSMDKIRLCVEVKLGFTVKGKGLGQNISKYSLFLSAQQWYHPSDYSSLRRRCAIWKQY